jgi:anti-sigma regulatory factor (Ser/Thr protein kinase)
MGEDAAARTVSRRLEHGSGAGAEARELVLELLADHHTTTAELRHDAALVAYELVANAVTHGSPEVDGTIELTCAIVDDVLTVRVRDAGRTGLVAPRPIAPEVGHGRGLAIVDALSSSWTVDRTDGTIVVARVPLSWSSAGRV